MRAADPLPRATLARPPAVTQVTGCCLPTRLQHNASTSQHVRGHAGSPAAGWQQQLQRPSCQPRASCKCCRLPGWAPAGCSMSTTWLLLAPPPCSSTTIPPGNHVKDHAGTPAEAWQQVRGLVALPKASPLHPALPLPILPDPCQWLHCCMATSNQVPPSWGQGRHTGTTVTQAAGLPSGQAAARSCKGCCKGLAAARQGVLGIQQVMRAVGVPGTQGR
jgi:hypothetical protein